MARIVCQVLHRSDRITFLWSEGAAFFEPYHIEGTERTNLLRQAREIQAMLATASERFPRGGALLMGLMGTAGTLSIQFVLPLMGAIFDRKKVELAGGDAAPN